MPDLSPGEISRLEDALEHLDEFEHGEADAPVHDDAVAHRLNDYRRVLAITRVALPQEVVDADVLTDVLAHARAELANEPRVQEATSAASTQRRSSIRWLFPVLAMAGATALVLLFVFRPGSPVQMSTPGLAGESMAAKADATPKPASHQPEIADDQDRKHEAPKGGVGVPAGIPAEQKVVVEEAAPAAEAKAEEQEAGANFGGLGIDGVASEDSDKNRGQAAPSSTRARRATSKPAGDVSSGSRTASPKKAKTSSSSPTGASLERGDKLRRAGRCAAATAVYRDIATHGSASQATRARAEAGQSLCAEKQGATNEAARHLSVARKLDPAIDAWIQRERDTSSQ